MKDRTKWALLALAGLAGLFVVFAKPSGNNKTPIKINVPSLSAEGQQGLTLFTANCAKCHGQNAAGTTNGPPLVHKIYEPNHHGDISFQRAARYGVQSHHWPFGNMPPVPGITDAEVARVVTYIRELQRANGIF